MKYLFWIKGELRGKIIFCKGRELKREVYILQK